MAQLPPGLSTRGLAGSGSNVLSIGFSILGTTAKTVVVRGVGPTLSAYSLTGVLPDPRVTVYDSSQDVVATNTGWGGGAALVAAFNSVMAFPLPSSSKDSAVLATLPPGTYTAQVTSVSGTTGMALLELYELP